MKNNKPPVDTPEQDDYDSDSQFSNDLAFQPRRKGLAEEFDYFEKEYSYD